LGQTAPDTYDHNCACISTVDCAADTAEALGIYIRVVKNNFRGNEAFMNCTSGSNGKGNTKTTEETEEN